ncbi:MAG TPA: hypothetical protein VGK40_01555, partial [Verrucomicrobiae bacterium]
MKLKSVPRGLLLVALALVIVSPLTFWRHELPLAGTSPASGHVRPAAVETSKPLTAPLAHPLAATAGSPPTNRLDPQNHFLDVPAAKPDFALFADWAKAYAEAQSPAARAALEDEGVDLAIARREALAALIQTDPKSALELAVPFTVRQSLPPPVA